MKASFTKRLSTIISMLLILCGFTASSQTMYLHIEAPSTLEGDYYASNANFGPANSTVTAPIVLVSDTFACATLPDDLTGKIALIRRGTCGFLVKVANAQAAGAVGVIICNNNIVDSNAVQPMGFPATAVDTALAATITIPVVMISLNDCIPLMADLANGTVGTITTYGNTQCLYADVVTEGTYTVPELSATPVAGASHVDATNARWYSYTAPTDGLLHVYSCGGGADTRLWIHSGTCAALITIGGNDDACEMTPGGDAYASDESVPVNAGVTYLIEWDDRWDPTGFDFTLELLGESASAGQSCENATVVSEGTHTADTLLWYGASHPDANASSWYSYTPATTGLLTVGSCEGGSDTRLWIYTGDCDNLVQVGANDDTCSVVTGGTDLYASEVSGLIVDGGTTYLIEWDDRWSASGFTFDITLEALGAVNVTFLVDMSGETVDPAGVHIAGSFQGWDPAATLMNDQGNGIWTYTASLNPGETIEYKFINGDAWGTCGEQQECLSGPCTNGTNDNRSYTVTAGDQSVGLVCYNSCFTCASLDCVSSAIICDDFDGYPTGSTTEGAAPWWTVWTAGGPGGDIVSDENVTGPNSMHISGTGQQDVLLLLGNQTTGKYRLRWEMYVPAGADAYYNIQNDETPGLQYNMDVYFGATPPNTPAVPGVGLFQQPNVNFNYPEGEWFTVDQVFDLDNDMAWFTIEGNPTLPVAYTGNLGAIDFYSINSINDYYIDNVEFTYLGGCDAGANTVIICDGLELYADGSTISEQAPHWSTWSGVPGGADDANVTSEEQATGYNSLEITGNTTSDVLLLMGDQTAGKYEVKFSMYIPSGSIGYYNFQGDVTPGTLYMFEVYLGQAGNGGAITPGEAHNIVGQTIVNTFNYPEDQWFDIVYTIDLDNDTYDLNVDGTAAITGAAYVGNLSSIDFYSAGANNHYYIDDVLVSQIPTTTVLREVTLEVDMEFIAATVGISPDGVHVAGDFQSEAGFPGDWDPATTALTNTSGTIYSVTLNIPDGNYQYKFVNGNAWGTCDEAQECLDVTAPCAAGNDNRALTVAGNMTVRFCYDQCTEQCFVSTDNVALSQAIHLQPNPASNSTAIVYDLPATSDLTIRITNGIGQVIYTNSLLSTQNGQVNVNLANFTSGVYFVHFSDGKNTATTKLVVEK